MQEVKTFDKLNEIVKDCHRVISKYGARAKIALVFPGIQGKGTHLNMYPGGPMGNIIAETHDRRHSIVVFVAAEVITKLEELRNGIVTSGN